ncbi:helix-turn-helix domain-containing protein [Persicobacter psychrovividus]|uniref:HTH cro/C1-type domain-containing protein n=1 Tax=Persicobacter psychrovividus TaxID=387638 RepID=A0ABN6L7V4_9BACT|nr:hypothetical protein PEPS_13710 [Persicobacter psychrovividus]
METSEFNYLEYLETTEEKIEFLKQAKRELSFSSYIKTLCEVIKSIGVSKVAQKSDITRQTISRLINNKSKAIYAETLFEIERAIGL